MCFICRQVVEKNQWVPVIIIGDFVQLITGSLNFPMWFAKLNVEQIERMAAFSHFADRVSTVQWIPRYNDVPRDW